MLIANIEAQKMVYRKVLLTSCLLLLFLSITVQFDVKAGPVTINVPENYPTIQGAISHASPGDTIHVSSGTYNENLAINKNLTLVGESKTNTFIVGSGNTVIQVNFTTVNISGFTIMNGTNGIVLQTCTGSTIKENKITCSDKGIWLFGSDSNIISDNLISNSYTGIVLCGHSSENIVLRNTVQDNSKGIAFSGTGNLIYHNDFINNQNQTEIIASFSNIWNNNVDGNYWSDYKGIDANQDGIGDTPYLIDGNNQDNYPLMGVFSQFLVKWKGENYYVTTISNSTITDLNYGNSISLDVTGPEGTVGFCRITLPRALFDGDPAILVNGSPPITEKELPASNNTHVYLYFTYAHITTQAVITPEFLVIIVVSVLVISIIAAIIIAKKVRSKTK